MLEGIIENDSNKLEFQLTGNYEKLKVNMILKNSNRLPKSAPIPELKIYLIKPFKGPRKEQYELIKSPSSKFSIPIELECISVFYKFKGK